MTGNQTEDRRHRGDKPVTKQKPLAAVHRDLTAFAEPLTCEGRHTVDLNSLIAPMLTRFMAIDRSFRRAAKANCKRRCIASNVRPIDKEPRPSPRRESAPTHHDDRPCLSRLSLSDDALDLQALRSMHAFHRVESSAAYQAGVDAALRYLHSNAARGLVRGPWGAWLLGPANLPCLRSQKKAPRTDAI